MAQKTDPLIAAVRAVADGSGIDWARVEAEASAPSARRRAKQLRILAQIADVHRSDDDPGAPPGRPLALPLPVGERENRDREPARWGDLVLIEEIGQGSFGTVYRAHDPSLDRPIAVKLLRPIRSDTELESRLLHEGRILAKVRHPNVVTVYGAGKHSGRAGLWMEFVRGLTLEQMLASHGPFSAREAELIGQEICSALAAVHRAGLLHRDIKSQNVMREEGGRLVLMDFGSGQMPAEVAAADPRLAGTPLYLAPEVLQGHAASVQSDIYSLGVLLYVLVTNDFPVKANSIRGLLAAHRRREIVLLRDARPDVDESFVRVVEKAMQAVPARRFASAGQMEAALARVAGARVKGVAAPRLWAVPAVAERPVRHETSMREAPAPSVAVLPFSDLSPAKDQDFFCDGMTEELINALTQIVGLRVAARTSAFQFKGQARDVRQIGRKLNVATVLDGSVRKAGNRLRVTVELIGAADGYHLWSKRFTRTAKDVFAVQDQIANSVVRTLKGRMAADKSPMLASSHPRNLSAYGFYLEGRYHWNKRTEDELEKSVACFQRAIDRDDRYAQAYAGMADAYVTLATYGAVPAKDAMPKAKRALTRALRIDGGLAEAYACRGCVRSVFDWAWVKGERDFQRAIELNPSYPTAHHWYAINHLVPLGRFDEATDELGRALELDPLALAIKASLGMKSYFAGRYQEAVRGLSATIDLDERFGMARFLLGATYTELARYSDALRELEAALQFSGRTPEILAALGYLYGLSGDREGARSVLDDLVRLSADRYVSPARVAQVHIGLGERTEALNQLEAAQHERAADLPWLGVRPVFKALRAEPRFKAILEQMELTA